jgi:hypothetical protein
MSVHIFGNKIQQFYGGKGFFCFEGLYQQLNQQVLAPFFQAQRKLPRQDLVAYVLKKLGGIKCLH